jgi:hypothetical protein
MVDQTPIVDGKRPDWAVLIDPNWTPRTPDEQPPATAMVGGWPLNEEGRPGYFHPNPDFVPPTDATPSDPIDAVIRLLNRGEVAEDELIPTVLDAMLEVAVTKRGHLVIGRAPDGAPCVVVVTAAVHRQRAGAEHWAPVTAEQLLAALPDNTDILLNPDGPAPLRLFAQAVRDRLTEA